MDALRLGEFQLRWSVNEAGHQWIMEEDLSRQPQVELNLPAWPGKITPPVLFHRVHEPLLSQRWESPECTRVRQYAPLSYDGLFRQFANLGDDFDAMQAFANQYGLLTKGQLVTFRARKSDDEPRWTIVEPQVFWQVQIRTMDRLVWLWDRINGPRYELEKIVASTKSRNVDGELAYDVDIHFPAGFDQPVVDPVATINRSGTADRLLPEHEPEGFFPSLFQRQHTVPDPVESATLYLSKELNEILAGHARPVILPWQRGQITIWLDSLLAGMYAQFAIEVAGRSVPIKVCEAQGCGKPFEPTRRSQRFCSPECRNRSWYRQHPKRPRR